MNGLSITSRTGSGRASYGDVVGGMGASVADGGVDLVAVVAGGAASFPPEQAMAAAATSNPTMPRQTPACVQSVFIYFLFIVAASFLIGLQTMGTIWER